MSYAIESDVDEYVTYGLERAEANYVAPSFNISRTINMTSYT